VEEITRTPLVTTLVCCERCWWNECDRRQRCDGRHVVCEDMSPLAQCTWKCMTRACSARRSLICAYGVVYHACTIFRTESNLMVCDSSNHKVPFLSRILHTHVKHHSIDISRKMRACANFLTFLCERR